VADDLRFDQGVECRHDIGGKLAGCLLEVGSQLGEGFVRRFAKELRLQFMAYEYGTNDRWMVRQLGVPRDLT
jgi:hypothetical protein